MVCVRLYDRAVVWLSPRAAEDVYEQLWVLAPQAGAVTTAAKIHHALHRALARTIELDQAESEAFHNACTRAG